jgi:polygalacturonase
MPHSEPETILRALFIGRTVNNRTIYIHENKNWDSIQNAINALDEQGGTIYLRSGKHYSYPITLKSGISLYLEKNSELIFTDDFSLYNPVFTRWEGTECYALQSMIFAEHCSNIRIYGQGSINGQGGKWWTDYKNLKNGSLSNDVQNVQKKLAPLNSQIRGGSGGGGRETGFLRPSLIQFKDCSQIDIEGVTLKDSPFWNTHILYCHSVTLLNVSFLNPYDAPNTDGLDIDSSEYVTVENCFFNVGDDCLCLKSGMDENGIFIGKPTSHIFIHNCTMHNGHGAVVIGSETSGGIKDVIISHCSIVGTDRGIRIKTRRGRGGTVENIKISNIEMHDVITPIVINMFYRCGADPSELEKLKSLSSLHFDRKKTPVIRNIKITNIEALNVASSAAFFLGLPESQIDGMEIENFSIGSSAGATLDDPAMDLFYTKAEGHEIICSYIKNLKMKNITIDDYSGLTVRPIHREE